jgi:dephospho-CoA kinase
MGSGKSTVAGLLRGLGFPVLDADAVARAVIAPGSPGEAEVLKTFGRSVAGPDGGLDRRALGRVVFGDEAKLQTLEDIVHPHVRREVASLRKKLAAAGHGTAFYDVPLLFEKNMLEQFDRVIVVSAPKDLCARRLKKRSNWSEEEIEERTMRHLPIAVKESAADAVIRNAGGMDDLKASVHHALAALKISLPKT